MSKRMDTSSAPLGDVSNTMAAVNDQKHKINAQVQGRAAKDKTRLGGMQSNAWSSVSPSFDAHAPQIHLPLPQNAHSSGYSNLLYRSSSSQSMSMTPQAFRCSPAQLLMPRRKSHLDMLTDFISLLPNEVLHVVLTFCPKLELTRLSAVNRRLFHLTRDHRLWRFIDLGKKVMHETSVHHLIDKGMFVLRMARTHMIADPLFNHAAMACQLTHLDMSCLGLNNAGVGDPQEEATRLTNIMAGILSRCHNLSALSVESCQVNDACCEYIAQNSRLVYLCMAMTHGITVHGITTIVHACTQLEELNMAWTTSMPEQCLTVLCANLPATLLRLNVSGGRKPPSLDQDCRQSVNDDDVVQLCTRCPNLVEMDISDCARVTVVGLSALMTMSSLKVLHCNRCYGIEPIHFANECGDIAHLNVIGCVTTEGYDVLRNRLQRTNINSSYFSTVARPTVGSRRTSIWTQRTRDE